MDVLFDLEPVLAYPGGIPIYTAELAKAITALPHAPHLVGAYATARTGNYRRLTRQMEELGLNVPVSWIPLPGRLAGKFKSLAWHAARPRLPEVDLVHVTSCLPPAWIPFGRKKSVMSVYDLGFVRYPNEGFGSPKISAQGTAFGQALKIADHIIAISCFTKREICALYNINEDKISVAYLAPQWSEIPGPQALDDQLGILEKYGLRDQRYVLAVGTISPRKNYPMLIEAFRKFKAKDQTVKLMIVGKIGWGEETLITKLEEGIPGVVWGRNVSATELACLYRRALVSCTVSKYEGFGIPVLESMVYGCPVIYATGSSLGEVAGDAGIAVDPDDPECTTRALHEITMNAERRAELAERGKKRASEFSWKRAATETCAVYEHVMQQTQQQRTVGHGG